MQSQELPPKELSLFRQIVKFYESKQYKKGIKTADSILKKYSDHGETLCMKGLLLNGLDKRDEAYQLARQGLKLNLKSHVCWHVLGLIYRSDRNYVEAAKCYKSALRMDPGNAQIMRDLSLLQLHERDLTGYAETRRQLLVSKPSLKQSWLAFAMAEHMRGLPEPALDILKKMRESFINTEDYMTKYEKSELVLYTAMLMIEATKLDEALSFLVDNDSDIVDKITKLEYLTFICFSLTRFDECKRYLDQLLSINNTHEGYILTLLSVCGVILANSPDQVKKWLKLGESDYSANKDWSTEKRIKVSVGNREMKVLKDSLPIVARDLKILPQTELKDKLDQIRSEFIGPLVKCDSFDLISLYLFDGSLVDFKSLATKFIETKISKGVPSTFKLVRGLCIQSPEKTKVIESLLLEFVSRRDNPVFSTFAMLALGSYYDFVGDYSNGLKIVDEAIEITPTLIDLYILKSKLFKHSGDLKKSSDTIEYARTLDLADRYLNSKSVKGLLRIGEIERARETIMLFAKDTSNAEKSNLTDMQCMWWEFELGQAHAKKGEWDKAVSTWMDTRKHFQDMSEDEFDFNSYCLRKMTIRSFIEFMRLQDRITGHRFYRRVAKVLVEAFLKPDVQSSVKDPLAEAKVIISELRRKSADWKRTHKLAFEVHMVTKEYKECLDDAKKMKALGSRRWNEYLDRLSECLEALNSDSLKDREQIQKEISIIRG
jgi:tetratricopeptide (TPR) repeat protein